MVVIERPIELEEVSVPVVTVSDFFNKAAEIIEFNGWNQGEIENDRKEVCALGAIKLSAAFFRIPSPISRRRMNMEILKLVAPIVNWNDEPGRTKEEVIALFHRLAEEF